VLKLPLLPENVIGFAQVSVPPLRLNVAVTVRAAVIATVQVAVPVQAPLQPANTEPAAGAAVSVTDAPLLNAKLHSVPQLIPAGDEVTVPVPLPARVTVAVNVVVPDVLNVAVTARATVIETVHVLVPVQAPLQPANVDPPAAAAVSVTDAPLA
jgi:hypothetical protein